MAKPPKASPGRRSTDNPLHGNEFGDVSKMLRYVLDATDLGILMLDRDQRVVTWNERYCELTGSRDLIKEGLPLKSLISLYAEAGHLGPGDPKELAAAHMQRIATESGPTDSEVHLADGRKILIHRRATSDGGQANIYRDVTAVREAETESRAILDSSQIGVGITNLGGDMLYMNSRAAEMLDMPIDDLAGIDSRTFYYDEDDRRRVIKEVRENGFVRDMELHVRGVDGEPFWALMTIRQLTFNGEPALVGWFGDISRTKQAEGDLMRALESSQISVVITDPDGRFLFHNSRALDLFNISEADVENATTYEFYVNEEDRKRFLHSLAEDGFVRDREVLLRKRGGEPLWGLFSTTPVIYQGEDAVMSWIADISLLKKYEHELAEKESQLRSALDSMTGALFMTDKALTLQIFNENAAEMFGVPRELIYKGASIAPMLRHRVERGDYGEEDPDQLVARRLDAYRRPEVSRTLDRLPGGRVVEVILAPTDDGGKVVLGNDITDLLQAQAELSDARDQAEAANQSKSAFLANMSHEIRTPMSAITGMIQLALQTELTPRQRDYLLKAENAADSLLRILNDILDFSKIEAGKLTLESTAFRLDSALEELTNIVLVPASAKGLELVFDIDPRIPDVMIGDPLRLQQVFINLLINAVKFTETGEIVLRARRGVESEGAVEIEFVVTDTGVGLTDSQISRLFDAFTQADESTTRKYGGTGLGLAICKQLIEMMGGEIHIESSPGQGTAIHFTTRFALDPEFASAPLSAPDALRGTRVLVVDDNRTARDTLAAMLASIGLSAFTVDSAETALAELERAASADPAEHYYAVLMDWRMPGLDGLEAAYAISKSERLPVTPVVIMVTVYEKEEVMRQPNSDLLADCLTKPVNASSLLDTLMDVFGVEITRMSRIKSTDDSAARIRASLSGARVLLVEDHDINQQIATEILTSQGVEIVIADNGEQAVNAVTADPSFDAILMDLQMPIMDGYEATRIIRSKGMDIPIIAMTAHAMLEERQRCLEAGMNDHVSKPVNPEQLFASLSKFLVSDGSEHRLETIAGSAGSEKPPAMVLPQSLPGIDIGAGVRRLNGNANLYLRLLGQFSTSSQDVLAQISAAIDSGDLEAARQAAHAIAGAAGNVSADEVAQIAKRLELQCAAGINANEELMAELQAAFASLLPSIAQLSEIEFAAPEVYDAKPRVVPDAQTLAPALGKLASLLSTQDLAAEDCLQALKAQFDFSGVKALIDAMDEDLDALRYPHALESLQRLAVSFQVDLSALERER